MLACRVVALFLGALSLGLSFAHVLEAPPRLRWSAELWREATVFGGQFKLFGMIGGPLEFAVIAAAGLLTWLARGERAEFWPALAATVLFAAGLGLWLAVVAPANSVLASWTPGPPPADFEAVRARWETGHILIACVKVPAFLALAWAVARG